MEKNNNEIPKAIQNDVAKAENKSNKETEEFKKVKPKNTFIKKYIIFIVVLMAVTGLAIFFTINPLSKPQEEKVEEVAEEQENQEIVKNEAEDAKYAIKKYSETYNENDLKILNYVDVDGNVSIYENIYEAPDGNKKVNYIQIDGLKNKTIQNKVNERLKSECYKLKSNNVSSNVTANFSNILSISISGYIRETEEFENSSINIDLTTGENVPFEKIFVSSAPINSYLTEGLYKTLAWDEKAQNTNEDNWEMAFDMSKIDTSKFEDKSIMLINNYKKAKEKGEIQFSITPSKVTVYGLADEKIVKNEYLRDSITIEFKNKIEEVAIYKRYLTDTSIFENNNIGLKNVIVCTNPTLGYESGLRNMFKILNYGKVSDNIFMEDVIENISEEDVDDGYQKIIRYFQNQSNETKKQLKVESGKGLIYQRKMSIYKEVDEKYYVANVEEIKATCSEEYYHNLAFKDYIENKNQPTVGPTYFVFGATEYDQKIYPNLTLKGNMVKDERGYETFPRLYFSTEGEYLGTTEAEAKEKTAPKQEKTETITQPKTEVQNNTINENTINMNNTNTANANSSNNTNSNNTAINKTTTNTSVVRNE